MKSLEQIRSDNWVEQEVEKDYFERTGKQWYWLTSTQKRKEIENWKEDHQ
jgi:hypothetical protein